MTTDNAQMQRSPIQKRGDILGYGIEYLKRKLTTKQLRVARRYGYYEMKNRAQEISSLIPEGFRNVSRSLGWCAKAVDSLADRTVFDSFENDNFGINEIYKLNNADILFDNAVLSAFISSCSFIYIGRQEGGYPSLQVIDGGNATGIIDPVTNMLTEGYAVLKRDDHNKPILEAYFLPKATYYYVNGRIVEDMTMEHEAPFALLVPIINRPDAKRPFGHSRISRACMDIVQAVMRNLGRMEVSAEFYSIPQKYVVGLSEEAQFNGKKATYSSFLDIREDENGNKPTIGQFAQQSMTPFTEQLKTYASMFAGETGLTMDDLGFNTVNPSSSDAIKAAHENLRLMARKAQRTFGTGFLNAGYLAACVRDDYEYNRIAFADTKALWLPIFEPDASSMGVIGDAILKVNQASEGFMGSRNIRQLTGLESDAE